MGTIGSGSPVKSGRQWRSYAAGGGVILLFGVLLFFRLGVQSRLVSGTGGITAPALDMIPVGESWLSITQQGRKIGYANRSFLKTESGFRFFENIFMRINTMGIVQPLTVRTTADLKPDGSFSGFRFDLSSQLFRFTARGEVSGARLTVYVGAPGEEKTSVVDLPQAPYLGGGILASAKSWKLKPGEERRVSIFDPASLGQREVRITFVGKERLVIMGKIWQAEKMSVDLAGMKQLAWIDAEGLILREEGILGIVLVRTSREDALAGLEGAASADMTELAAIPTARSIDAPADLKVLKIRLEGLSDSPLFLDGGRQAYRNGLMTVRRESIVESAAHSRAMATDLAPFLKPSSLIQSDHPMVRQSLNDIIMTRDSDEAKAKKIVAWVFRNLEKRPVLSVPNAVETLQKRVGDCNEHAALLAAFARAAGIPAEVEAGVVYLRGHFYYHAWNVLFIREWGGWVTADAVLGQFPADATHIRFARGALDRQLDLLGLIGKLKIEILETER